MMLDDMIFNAILHGNAATTATTSYEEPQLTVETMLAAMQELLPKVQYQATELLPALDNDGKPAIWSISQPYASERFGARNDIDALVLLHPDNLPEFLEQSKGRCRLIPVTPTKASE